jgi:hypothetical protein
VVFVEDMLCSRLQIATECFQFFSRSMRFATRKKVFLFVFLRWESEGIESLVGKKSFALSLLSHVPAPPVLGIAG